MARKRRPASAPKSDQSAAAAYRHKGSRRKNLPPAALAAAGIVEPKAAHTYEYSPRLPPTLRFDTTGDSDKLPPLLEKAKKGKLTADEVEQLAAALRAAQAPWLEWAGKRERPAFAVDPVALHCHERVSAQAIVEVARKQNVERSLFADPELEYREAVQFYKHNVDWSNRLILGDSLQVMASLIDREELAGKVQMIYLDPPYGIKFASNFQPEVGKRDVKDKDTDLTREPETVRAYRDTWHLGVHSYLTYLRDRLRVAKELLADSGSIFVQISDENLHRVRSVLDEVFGSTNFMSQITFTKTTSATDNFLSATADYILWYARDKEKVKFRQTFLEKTAGEVGAAKYDRVIDLRGFRRPLSSVNNTLDDQAKSELVVYTLDNLTSQSEGRDKGEGAACWYPVAVDGQEYRPTLKGRWKTNEEGMQRLVQAHRTEPMGNTLRYARYLPDFPVFPIANVWTDIGGGVQSRSDPKVYVVQTGTGPIQRCLLMTTDPGDLVLDPTCGSGTTAYVAEQWRRRWITIDTSRVAVAIARQRLLTAKYDYFTLREPDAGVAGGFKYKTVPHVTLKSIAQNAHLDPIFAKHEPGLDARLTDCNKALAKVTDELRHTLLGKLNAKEKKDGKRSITDADRRRWLLPKKGGKWEHWHVPFDTDADWPKALSEAVNGYRQAWRAKMAEVNACIAANAEQEELVDQPAVERNTVRVSGPFTVEAVQPPEMSLGEVFDTFAGAPESAGPTFAARQVQLTATAENVEAYLDRMVRFLRTDGVTFPNNKRNTFTRLDAIYAAADNHGFHAEGRWVPAGETDADPQGEAVVGVVFGPQYGAVTNKMIEEFIKPASRRYDELVIAGFSFTAEAQALIEENPHPKLRIHMAHVRPDINPGMDGLLKDQPGGQLFTVFGQPRTLLTGPSSDGEFTVEMEGVDVYNPVTNEVMPTGADKVAAWFLDADYDGQTFCICQAFFPDRDAWGKLARALGDKGVIDEERFAALSGTMSLPFRAGKHAKAAVKVIDPRGNEVMRVHGLNGKRKK